MDVCFDKLDVGKVNFTHAQIDSHFTPSFMLRKANFGYAMDILLFLLSPVVVMSKTVEQFSFVTSL